MNVKDFTGKIYMTTAVQFNFSRGFSRLLKENGWKDKQEIYYSYNEKTGQITISKTPDILALLLTRQNKKAEEENAAGLIWNEIEAVSQAADPDLLSAAPGNMLCPGQPDSAAIYAEEMRLPS